jgi:hypothetical protein
MMAIWPAGPPKLMNPNFSQKAKACQKLTGAGGSVRAVFTVVFGDGMAIQVYRVMANAITPNWFDNSFNAKGPKSRQ